MKKVWLSAIIYAACCAAHAQVYRCEVGGKVSYTDAPCGSGAVRSVEVQGNRIERVRTPPTIGAPAQAGAEMQEAGPAPGACPSDLDVQNIDTRLSGHVVPAKNRAALHYERSKALRCRSFGGRYEHDDWKRLAGVLRGED
jgi:hypothetical protein